MSKEYLAIIDELNGYVADKKTNIILLENPPYRDTTSNTHLASSGKGTNIIKDEMASEKRWVLRKTILPTNLFGLDGSTISQNLMIILYCLVR